MQLLRIYSSSVTKDVKFYLAQYSPPSSIDYWCYMLSPDDAFIFPKPKETIGESQALAVVGVGEGASKRACTTCRSAVELATALSPMRLRRCRGTRRSRSRLNEGTVDISDLDVGESDRCRRVCWERASSTRSAQSTRNTWV